MPLHLPQTSKPLELASDLRSVHPVDPHLPAHWEGIEPGQTRHQRAAAIIVNIAFDERKRARGIDPKTGERAPVTASEALARAAALRR